MLYNEKELQDAIKKGEVRLAEKRQKRRRSQRNTVAALIVAAIVVPFCVLTGVAAGHAPAAPFLVVVWPKPKVQQTMASGQKIVMRQGQPLMVSVTGSSGWDITWRTGDVENNGEEFSWAPTSDNAELVAMCKAHPNDWTSPFARFWPARQVNLKALFAEAVAGDTNQYRRQLSTDANGAWIFPHIQAVGAGTVAWDERALPLLANAIPVLPKADLANKLASVSDAPTAPLWRLVSDFDGHAQQPATDATYASLLASDLESTLPTVAAQLVKSSPDASIKFILRLDKDPQDGIIRLAFDGKHERKAWVRRAGQSAGAPFTGWESGEFGGQLPMTLPPSPPHN